MWLFVFTESCDWVTLIWGGYDKSYSLNDSVNTNSHMTQWIQTVTWPYEYEQSHDLVNNSCVSCDCSYLQSHVTLRIHSVVWLFVISGSCDYWYSLIHVTESRATCNISYSYVTRGVFMCVAWRIHTWHLTHVSHLWVESYGVATIGRLLQIIGLFCKRAL